MTYYYGLPLGRVMRQRMMEHMMEHEWPERDYSFPVDVKAETEGYDVTALLPGLSADEVDIQIDSDTVTIQGEFKAAGTRRLITSSPNFPRASSIARSACR